MAFEPEKHLTKVKGGQLYMQVKDRLIWGREMHPEMSIEVELLHLDLDLKLAVARATVTLPNGVRCSDIGSETEADFPAGWIEKACTKAVGRALAALGFGTQFALEIDEGESVADSPAPTTAPARAGTPPRAPARKTESPQEFAQRAAAALEGAAADESAAQLRAEVVRLLTEDGGALDLLKTKGTLPPDMNAEQLAKTKRWLETRRARTVPHSTRLARQIEAASTEEEVKEVMKAAQAAKDARQITQAEFVGLLREAETRRTALAGPLTAGAAP